jgi:pilus assembly protein FimV
MKSSLKATLIATAIATLPLGAHAAGLGAINVFSGLGQPLRAEIELRASSQELQSLTARVAPVDAFRQANVPYAAAMTGIRVAVESRGDRAVVRVSSDTPVNDPFVDMLLEINWASGRLLREYTFLLDPVELRAPAPVAARVSPPAAASEAPRPGAPARADRYEVKRGDTLHRVAEMHRLPGASLEQTLLALFRENPAAFDGANMNRLRAGAILSVPGEGALQAVEPAAARREVLAHSADFEAYRNRLAGAVAARPPAPEQAATQAGAGTIVPRVDEGPRSGDTGDRVRVSGAPAENGAVAGADDARIARLQSLEEELVARDKALDEANGRLAELEKNIRDLQQMLELRNRSLAQLQGQAAGGADAPAAAPVAPVAETQAPRSESPQPQPPVRQALPDEPVPEPSVVASLLDDPLMLAGGGAIGALLLGYAGFRARQRRHERGGATDSMALMSELPAAPNSVFGGTGGQSVDTSNSSVIHTDFSQSGLSAIDADEGVDPVAEADVYMAYGRDAQAEEILLDALKADASRAAIFLKLLEIYAQRKSLKQFETIASDLYSRTGGEGSDWEKAAEMGRAVDPDNPLYRSSAVAPSGAGPATEQPQVRPSARVAPAAGMGQAAGVGAAASLAAQPDAGAGAAPAPLSALDFTTSIPGMLADGLPTELSTSQINDAPALRGGPGQLAHGGIEDDLGLQVDAVRGEDSGEFPEIDATALDFDLDLGDVGDAPVVVAGATAPDAEELTFDLVAGDDDVAAAIPAEAPADAASMSATVIGHGMDFAAASEEFAPALDSDEPPMQAAPVAFDIDATMLCPPELGDGAGDAVMDLEKTTFDSSLLDFDFDLEGSVPEAASGAPALDLSGIDLELEVPGEEVALAAASPAAQRRATAEAEQARSAGVEFVPDAEAAQEIDTKLELARAYEEMGDKEGARELIEEVLRDGTDDQRGVAGRLLERLV